PFASSLEASGLQTPVPSSSVTRRVPAASASSIAAAILSASETDDPEHAFDDMTGEFETRPRDLLTPPPQPPDAKKLPTRSTGAMPNVLKSPTSFARATGEQPALPDSRQVARGTQPPPDDV